MAKKDEDEDLIEKDEDEDADGDEKDDDSSDKGKPSKKDDDDDDDGEVEVVLEDDEDDKDDKIEVKKNKDYSQEGLEEKRARRREEKKKKRHQDYLARQDARKFKEENAELKKRLEALEQMAPQFKQRVDAQEEAQLDTAIGSQVNLYKTAEAHLEKAITEGNGAAAKEAQRVMFDANNKYSQLVALKQRHKETSVQEKEVKKESTKPEVGEAHRMYARRWSTENTWFDPHGDDEDSETAKIIDKQMMKEGYDPNRRDFWDEFNDRLKEELPHIYEEKRQKRTASPRTKQVNGSIGADTTSGGSRVIKIPERVKKMAIDAGQWDDPKMKKIFIKNWLEQQQNLKVN